MTIAWFKKTAGDDVAPSTEDPAMSIVGCDVPDYVHLPAELGGECVGVTFGVHKECPRGEHVVRHRFTKSWQPSPQHRQTTPAIRLAFPKYGAGRQRQRTRRSGWLSPARFGCSR